MIGSLSGHHLVRTYLGTCKFNFNKFLPYQVKLSRKRIFHHFMQHLICWQVMKILAPETGSVGHLSSSIYNMSLCQLICVWYAIYVTLPVCNVVSPYIDW